MKRIVVFLLLAVMLFSVGPVYAWPGWHHHERYYRYYGGHWWLGDTIVAGLVAGAIIEGLPPRCRIVSIGGVPYYYDGFYYYQSSPAGFVVVQPAVAPVVVAPPPVPAPVAVMPAPAAVVAPPVVQSASVTVNIKNGNGSVTQIMLVRKGRGFVGPQGEYYEVMPTKKQLKALYGR